MANPNPVPRPGNLRPYPKGVSGNPKGRPKNDAAAAISRLIEEDIKAQYPDLSDKELRRAVRYAKAEMQPLTHQEISTWRGWLMVAKRCQLVHLAKHPDGYPAFAVGNALAILSDMKLGRTTTMDKLEDREYGKPTASIAASIDFSALTEMQLDEIIAAVTREIV